MTLWWSPSHPMADAVPWAPVKASVLMLKVQRYCGRGPAVAAAAVSEAVAMFEVVAAAGPPTTKPAPKAASASRVIRLRRRDARVRAGGVSRGDRSRDRPFRVAGDQGGVPALSFVLAGACLPKL